MWKTKSSGRTNSARSWPCAATRKNLSSPAWLTQLLWPTAPPRSDIDFARRHHRSVNAANSGSAAKFLPSPKASLIFGPWANTEFYLQGGFSFHSNDGRGATQVVEPVSPDNPYPNTICRKSLPWSKQKGGEIGVRTVAVPHLQSTFRLWYLHSNSELTQDGDTGGTICFRTVEQPLWH